MAQPEAIATDELDGRRDFDFLVGAWRVANRSRLEPPMVGRFDEGVGLFEGDDTIDGRAVKVRFDWTDIGPRSARWEQSFSFDGGRRYAPNWVMAFMRIP
jgi:hypothetical protein